MDENVTNTTTGQNTTAGYELDPQIEMFKILITCILALVMFGMGCAVDYQELIKNFKKPAGLLTGLACQIFMMPLLAYGLIKATSMSQLHGMIFMAVGCSPGGLFSNIITMMVDGDMPLSIALTSTTNILAFGTVPFWIFLYSWIEKVDEDLKIPYSALGISLASLVIPIVFGILFRCKFVKPARILSKGCAVFGFILLIVIVVAMLVRNEVPIVFSVETVLPVVILPVIGMGLSYTISLIPCLGVSPESRRTIAIETSIQNGNLSNNIVLLTYADRMKIFTNVITVPLMYSIAQSTYNVLLVAIYKGWNLQRKHCQKKVNTTVSSAIGYQQMEMT